MMFSTLDKQYIKEALSERVQLTDWGTVKHRNYKRLLEKINKIWNETN